MLQNGILRVCFYFCSTEWNSELFSLPRNCSEWNSESLLLFLFYGTEFPNCFLFCGMVQTKFREFASIFVPQYRIPSIFLLRGTAGNPLEQTTCSVYSVFWGILYCRKLLTLSMLLHMCLTFSYDCACAGNCTSTRSSERRTTSWSSCQTSSSGITCSTSSLNL